MSRSISSYKYYGYEKYGYSDKPHYKFPSMTRAGEIHDLVSARKKNKAVINMQCNRCIIFMHIPSIIL
jgi:hypothetical protein